AVVDDDADDRRQALTLRLAAQELRPAADEVLEHAQHHEAVRLALVLEEKPDVAGCAAKPRLEERVAEALVELLPDEVALHELERVLVDGVEDGLRQNGRELARRVLRHAKGALEEQVVLCHRRAEYQNAEALC